MTNSLTLRKMREDCELVEDKNSFFESKEWRSYAACRKPSGHPEWEEDRRIAAKLQRTVAASFYVDYLSARTELEFGAEDRKERCAIEISEIEAKARAWMEKTDMRRDKWPNDP